MKTILSALRIVGILAIIFATGFFIVLYVNLTQLILALGIAGLLIFGALIYIFNWMQNKDEELEELNRAIDLTREYVREVEKKNDSNNNEE